MAYIGRGVLLTLLSIKQLFLLSGKGITIVFSPSFGTGTTGNKPQKTHLTKVGCVFLPFERRIFVLLVGIWLFICVFYLLSAILTCLGLGLILGFGLGLDLLILNYICLCLFFDI